MSRPFRLAVPVEVHLRDSDAFDHTNNAVYMTFLEIAREAYWREILGVPSYRDCGLILARTEIDFRSPSFVGETLLVSIRASRMGRTSFELEYEIREKETGRLVVEARSVQVMFDYEAGRKRPISERERRAMEPDLSL